MMMLPEETSQHTDIKDDDDDKTYIITVDDHVS